MSIRNFGIALALCTLISTAALAAGTQTVTINSWVKIDPTSTTNNAGEVCGNVSGTLTGQERVLITVDPGSNPGEYISLLAPDGNFCQVVNTYTGQVEASLVGSTAKPVSARAQLRK